MAHGMNAQNLHRSLIIALLFQIAWIVVGVLFTISGADVRWGLLIANVLTLWLPALLILLTRLNLSDRFQICFAIFITASSLVGSVLNGYGSIPNWDTVVHIYSGALLAWFGFIVAGHAEASIKKLLPSWFKVFVAFMTPLAFAALWEIFEYASDTYLGTTMQAGGLTDTIVDMFAALLGATVVVLFYKKAPM